MGAKVQWIKLSTDVFDNRKVKQIEAMPEGDAILVIWFKLLVLAGKINDNGMVYFAEDIPYTDDMLSVEFGRPIQTVRMAINTFVRFGMIEVTDDVFRLSGWEKYQNIDGLEKIRKQNRERQKRYYDRKHGKLSGEQAKPLPEPEKEKPINPMQRLFEGFDITEAQVELLVKKLKECTSHLTCCDKEMDYWRLYDEMSDLITLAKERSAKEPINDMYAWMKAVIATTDFHRSGPDFMRDMK